MIFTLYIELNREESCTMQVYHLKSSCQVETANNRLNDHILDRVGTDQNIVSSKNVDGTNGESGISTIILDIRPNLGDELRNLVNIDSLPLTNSTTLLIPT